MWSSYRYLDPGHDIEWICCFFWLLPREVHFQAEWMLWAKHVLGTSSDTPRDYLHQTWKQGLHFQFFYHLTIQAPNFTIYIFFNDRKCSLMKVLIYAQGMTLEPLPKDIKMFLDLFLLKFVCAYETHFEILYLPQIIASFNDNLSLFLRILYMYTM